MERIRNYFPYLFKSYYVKDKTRPFPMNIAKAFIPLRVIYCNADLENYFSASEVAVVAFPDPAFTGPENRKGYCDVWIYMGILYDIIFNQKNRGEIDGKLKNLGEFFDSDHIQCLKKMHANKDKINEGELQGILALHLFGPLVPDSKVTIDKYTGVTKCVYCQKKVEPKDTSFGNEKYWHGNADIMLEYSAVKVLNVDTESETSPNDTQYSGETLDYDIDGPPTKKTRLAVGQGLDAGDAGSSRDTDNEITHMTLIEVKLFSNRLYMPDGPKHIYSTEPQNNKVLSQSLSQTIVNAFLQVHKHKRLQHYFIPTFLASQKYVTIHMYNPDDDILITQAEVMPLFSKSGELDQHNILSIWMALNMLNFSRCTDYPELFEKSNFPHVISQTALEIYKNKLSIPLERSKKDNPEASTRFEECYSVVEELKRKLIENDRNDQVFTKIFVQPR